MLSRVILFPVGIWTGVLGTEGSASGKQPSTVRCPGRSLRIATILFIPLSLQSCNRETDWAAAGAEYLARQCPDCASDSIIGHGRRRKQAHDECHDWIRIRRGICKLCGKTFTFLPRLSPPYGHYSLITRSQALLRYFGENCSWERAAPLVKDPDRIPSPSTLRRWFRALGIPELGKQLAPASAELESPSSSQRPFPFLRKMVQKVMARGRQGEIFPYSPCLHLLLRVRI